MSKKMIINGLITVFLLGNSAALLATARNSEVLSTKKAAEEEDSLDSGQKQASAIAAQAWLNLIDAGNYNQAWENSSQILQLTMPSDEWSKLMNSVRKPLGSVLTRNILEQLPAQDPKGLPKGSYMVIYYNTTFQNRKDAKELITLFLGYDGQWRVLTYNVS